jgi:DNA-binding transcriptional ArsR family regulator
VSDDSLQSDHCAEMLRALADPVRLRIIDALRAAPRCVSELSESLDLEVVTVSHHLGILHAVGLLEREKKGRFKVYRLREGVLASANGDKQHIDLGCCRLEIPSPSHDQSAAAPETSNAGKSNDQTSLPVLPAPSGKSKR